MKIQPGDYMIWFGSKTKTGDCGFMRPDSFGSILEAVSFPDVEDKFYAGFIRSSDDFWCLGVIIAETHDMDVEPGGPVSGSDYQIFRIHDAVRFVSRSALKPE